MNTIRRIIAGAMSGTSADGVDVALVEIAGRGLEMSAKLLHHHAQAYDAGLRQRIFAVREAGHIALAELGALGRDISLAYAAAVNGALREANLTAADLEAVAAHGQTLYHAPPNTVQWFDPALVAAEVGCAVVSDFRRADCAAGGQGAPLVPYADYVLFRHATKNRVLLNIGGIANLTYIPAGASIDQVIAFDTGPGNCISDHICRTHLRDGRSFDEGGAMASSASPLELVCTRMLRDAFFEKAPPKSTDAPTMIALFEDALARSTREPDPHATVARQLSTAVMITSRSFGIGFSRVAATCDELIASGGGVRNAALMRMLQTECNSRMEWPISGASELPMTVLTEATFGIPSSAKEALAFALLGAATLDGIPSNVPSATGAKRAVVLGSITPKP